MRIAGLGGPKQLPSKVCHACATAEGLSRDGPEPASSFRLSSNCVRNSLPIALANFHLTGWLREHTNRGRTLLDPRTQIAAPLLGGTFNPTVSRPREERIGDIQIALELAERVLGRSAGKSPIQPIEAQLTDDGHTPTTEGP